MGSVISGVRCPNCGNEDAYNEYYYKSDEEFTLCDKCGYSYERWIAKKDDKAVYDINGCLVYNTKELLSPYCVLHFIGDKISQIYPIETEEVYRIVEEECIKSNNDKLIAVVMSRWNGKQIIEEELTKRWNIKVQENNTSNGG